MCRTNQSIAKLAGLRDDIQPAIHEINILAGPIGRNTLGLIAAAKVTAGESAQMARQVRLATPEMLGSRFQSLPPNVALTASSLHIDFDGADHFLAAVGSLIYALHNDFEKIRDFIEQDAGVQHPRIPT